MKKVLGVLLIMFLTGCSTPGKPAFYYPWTQYKTGIDIQLPKAPNIMMLSMGLYASTTMAIMR